MATNETGTISLNTSTVPPDFENSTQMPNPQDTHSQSNQNPLQLDPLILYLDTDSTAAPKPTTSTTKWPGWPGDCAFRLIVSVLKVGSIIGRKGDLIRKMCDKTRAHIRVLDAPVGTPDRIAELKKYKAEKEAGLINLDDDEIFEKVLGEEKHGRIRSHLLNTTASSYQANGPSKRELIKKLAETKEYAQSLKNKMITQFQEMKGQIVKDVQNQMMENFKNMLTAAKNGNFNFDSLKEMFEASSNIANSLKFDTNDTNVDANVDVDAERKSLASFIEVGLLSY